MRRSQQHQKPRASFKIAWLSVGDHLAVAVARSCIRAGARCRFYTVVDLVNRLEAETKAGRAGKIADALTRLDLVVLDELGGSVAILSCGREGGQLGR